MRKSEQKHNPMLWMISACFIATSRSSAAVSWLPLRLCAISAPTGTRI